MPSVFRAAAIGLLIASPATAWEFDGAEISLSAGHYFAAAGGATLQTGSAAAQAQFGLGEDVFVQLDTAAEGLHFLGSTEVLGAASLHLGYAVSPTTAVGAFALYETWPGLGQSYGAGAEIAFASGPFEVEAMTGLRGVVSVPISAAVVRVKGYYRLSDSFSLAGGASYFNTSLLGDFGQLTAGLRYDLSEDLSLELGYARTASLAGGPAANGIGLSLTKVIGSGTTFGHRDLLSSVGGW